MRNVNIYYDKQGNPTTSEQWSKLFNTGKHVKQDTTWWGCLISTVWLGIDHGYDENKPPLIFETMVFLNGTVGNEQDCRRYATEEASIAGHNKLLKKWGGNDTFMHKLNTKGQKTRALIRFLKPLVHEDVITTIDTLLELPNLSFKDGRWYNNPRIRRLPTLK